jgi:hypothetical protein
MLLLLMMMMKKKKKKKLGVVRAHILLQGEKFIAVNVSMLCPLVLV